MRTFRSGRPWTRNLKVQLTSTSAAGHSYRTLREVPHRFSRSGKMMTLYLTFKTPGRYQIRFRDPSTLRWSRWQTFQVVTPSPATTKAITTVKPSVGSLHFKPPTIREPKANQAFMLAGSSVNVKVKIAHPKEFKISTEFQRKEHSRYVTFHPKASRCEGKMETPVEARLAKIGKYRVRTKINAPHSEWSVWWYFKVDKPATKLIYKVAPSLSHSKGMHRTPSGIMIK